jgi:galactitol-specific phosphotransferase system IIB component
VVASATLKVMVACSTTSVVVGSSTQEYESESAQPTTMSVIREGEETAALPSTQVYVCSAIAAATSGGIGGSQAVSAIDALPKIAMLANNLETFIYLFLITTV